MKTFRVLFAFLLLGIALRAQDAAPPVYTAPDSTAVVKRTPEELEQLLGPIALYPDALIALILPASTVPTDIVLAARHLRENPNDRTQIEHRAWDESVKSLTNYPEVVQWMDENLQWTRQVGEAFATQSADVMQAIQRLRARAQTAGTLIDTPQQQVISEPQVIRIVPAQPDIIYVPHYEPDVVFVDRPIYYSRPFLTFGVGVPVGSWLAFDCDWRRHSIWVGNRHRRWTGHDWHRPVVPIAPSNNFRSPEVRQWRPPPQTVRTSVTVASRFRPEVVRPAPFGLASARVNTFRDLGPGYRRTDNNATPPALPQSNTFRPSFRNGQMGPQPTPSAPVAPQVAPQPQIDASATPAPNVQTSQPPRRGRDWSSRDGNNRNDGNDRPRDDNNRWRDEGNRGRNFRNNPPQQQPAASPPPPIITAPPVNVTPALPMNPARPSQSMGPRPERSFSRPTPAPDTAPGLSMRNRSSPPPPVTVPAPSPQAVPQASAPAAPQPQAAPRQAPAPREGGESRGHRGSYRREG